MTLILVYGVKERGYLIVYVDWGHCTVGGSFWVEFGGLLPSFLSLASRSICLRPALDIGDLGCVGVGVSCIGVCISQM